MSSDDVHVHATIHPGSSIASFVFYAKIPAKSSSRKTLLHLNDHTTCDFSQAVITNITPSGNAVQDTPAARLFKAPLLVANDPESSPLVARRTPFSPLVEKKTSLYAPDVENGRRSPSLSERSIASPTLRRASSRSTSPIDRFRKSSATPSVSSTAASTPSQSPLTSKPRPRAPSVPPLRRTTSILKNNPQQDTRHSDPFVIEESSSPMTDRLSGFFTLSPHYFQRVENDVQIVFSDDSVPGTSVLVQIPFDIPIDNWETEGWKTLCLANIFSELNDINLKVIIEDEESGDWIFKSSAHVSELHVRERIFSGIVTLPQISDFILDWKRRDEIELLHCDEGIDVKSSIELENNTARISNQVYFLGRGDTIISDAQRLIIRLLINSTEKVVFTSVNGDGILTWTVHTTEPPKSSLDKEISHFLDGDNTMQTVVPECGNAYTLEIERSNESIWEPIYINLQVAFTNRLVVPTTILSTSGTVYSTVQVSALPYHVTFIQSGKWRQVEPSNRHEMLFKNVCQNAASNLQNLLLAVEKIEFVGRKIKEKSTCLIRYTIDKCRPDTGRNLLITINAYLGLASLLGDSPILRFQLPEFSEIQWVSIDGKIRDNIVYKEISGLYAISDQEIFINDNQIDLEILCKVPQTKSKVGLPIIMDKSILKLLVKSELPYAKLTGTNITQEVSVPSQFHFIPPGEKLYIKFGKSFPYKRVLAIVFLILGILAVGILALPYSLSTLQEVKNTRDIIQDLAFDIALLNYQTIQQSKSKDTPQEPPVTQIIEQIVSPAVKELLQEPKRVQRQLDRIEKWSVPEDEKERFRAALTWWK